MLRTYPCQIYVSPLTSSLLPIIQTSVYHLGIIHIPPIRLINSSCLILMDNESARFWSFWLRSRRNKQVHRRFAPRRFVMVTIRVCFKIIFIVSCLLMPYRYVYSYISMTQRKIKYKMELAKDVNWRKRILYNNKEKVWTLSTLCLHQLRTLFIESVDFKLHYNILNKVNHRYII